MFKTGIIQYSGGIALTSIGNITGGLYVGQTVYAGAVAPAGATVTYQWYRNNNSTLISGATSSAYVLAAADEGYTISVRVTGTGGYSGIVTSANYATIGPAAPQFYGHTQTYYDVNVWDQYIQWTSVPNATSYKISIFSSYYGWTLTEEENNSFQRGWVTNSGDYITIYVWCYRNGVWETDNKGSYSFTVNT